MIDSKMVEKVIYDLCVQANTNLPENVYSSILNAYNTEQNADAKEALGLILQNAHLASEKKMPLCQDTGQVVIFARGKNFPDGFNQAVNKGVEKAYEENYFRKSVVKNAFFDRANTKTNTPCIIYTEIADIDEIEFQLLIKGAGSENVSLTKMLSPTSSEDEVLEFVTEVFKTAGSKACPPYFIGVGIGGTMEYAGILSKKALLLEKNIDEKHEDLSEKIKNSLNELKIGAAGYGGSSTCLDVKVLTDFTHIACLPVSVTISCHSDRNAKAVLKSDGKIEMPQRDYVSKQNEFEDVKFENYTKINASEIDKLKSLKVGDKILLSGEIYTARDAAHKKLVEMIDKGEELPFELKNSIIFYAGPCPCPEGAVVGSIGPTTSSRMDKFAPILYGKGLLATIGKGERSDEAVKVIKQSNGLYFTVIGGIACLLSEKFVKKEIVAFEELGTEAVYKFEVKDLPLRLAVG